jgi:NAD(P)-dependent dehydrogenase (short-subunit alcohol dehydrogenase family)
MTSQPSFPVTPVLRMRGVGGESGIGAACVTALATAGADVVVLFHQDEVQGEASAKAVQLLGRKSAAIRAEVSSEL